MHETFDWTVGRKGIYTECLILRIPPQIKDQLRALSKKKKLSISDLVRISIERLLNEEK